MCFKGTEQQSSKASEQQSCRSHTSVGVAGATHPPESPEPQSHGRKRLLPVVNG